jgi:peptidoglycan/LPS O-acetylase OafA/YrhL
MTTTRKPILDAARGIAASSVVLFHLFEISFNSTAKRVENYFQFGYAGVMLFFVISGYVIHKTVNRADSVASFATNRWFRIYPLFLVSLVAGWLTYKLGYLKWQSSLLFEASLPWNLTMLQEWFNKPSILPLYWTLGYEMVFYLVMGLLLQLKQQKQAWTLLPITSSFLFVLCIASILRGSWVGLGRVLEFQFLFLGVCFAEVEAKRISQSLLVVMATFTVATTAWVNYLSIPAHHTFDASTLIMGRWITVPAVIALCFWWANKLEKPAPKSLVFLGSISYSTYLMHGVIVPICFKSGLGTSILSANFWSIVLTLGISYLTFTYVEKPGIELGRRLRPKTQQKDT